MRDKTELSIVIPVYNEEKNLKILYKELEEVLKNLGKTYEIIFIDDGSEDKSFEVLKKIAESSNLVKVIKFSKNFGQTAAFDAGFKKAKGEIIITMDSDLQNDPKDIPKLLRKIDEGYDVVCGIRVNRKDSLIKKISSKIANYIRNKFTKEDIIDVGCSLKAFKSFYVKRLKLFNGMHRFFPTLLKLEGARIIQIPVNHRKRIYGKTKYGILNRAFVAFFDLLIVMWMKKRYLKYKIEREIN